MAAVVSLHFFCKKLNCAGKNPLAQKIKITRVHVYKFLKFAFEKLKTVVLQTAEKSLTGELKTGVKGEVIPHCKSRVYVH